MNATDRAWRMCSHEVEGSHTNEREKCRIFVVVMWQRLKK
jgi:hypothetical protein